MTNVFDKPFWESIVLEKIKNGDIIFVFYKNNLSYDHFKIVENKWFNIFEHKFIIKSAEDSLL